MWGYRYYERPDTKTSSLGRGKAGDFDATRPMLPIRLDLDFPYTTFGYSDFQVVEDADSFTVNVTVSNTGSVAGAHSPAFTFRAPTPTMTAKTVVEKAC